FDVGPLGSPVRAGHAHADLLGIQCSVFGLPHLVDPGTYGYTVEPVWRDFFRGTAAHSTVLVDGVEQAAPAGPFKWRQRPQARLRRWRSDAAVDFADASHDAYLRIGEPEVGIAAVDFADASHDAYLRLPDPVVHRRRVLFVKPRYWVV